MEQDDELATLVTPEARNGQAGFVLIVVDGPDRGLTFTLPETGGRVLLGTSPSCEVRLADPAVSRRHASIEVMAGGLRLTDLGSTNGTVVDRVRVTGAILNGDEVVRIGSSTVRFEPDERGPVAAAVKPRSFGRLLGESPAMRRLYSLCERLAASEVAVIIEGETGTGKEVLAESIHERGPRAREPFIVFDCTTVPPNLVESELFGHERGAFTGAVTTRKGVFEQAHGGTLLVDEIGDLDPALQPKLLRALERREIRRVGGDKVIRVDVRVLTATRRDLDREIQAGRFRDDLFHRIAVARIELPPLRDRGEDVELLAKHFCREMNGDPRLLRPELLARWKDSSWPGNVRELRNAVARQLALGDERVLPVEAVMASEQAPSALAAYVGMPFVQGRDLLQEDFENAFVDHWLARTGGDIGKAAAATGIGRRYFQKLRARRRV